MTTWLLDTKLVVYLLTRPEALQGAAPTPVDLRLEALYRALDAFIDRASASGDRLLPTPWTSTWCVGRGSPTSVSSATTGPSVVAQPARPCGCAISSTRQKEGSNGSPPSRAAGRAGGRTASGRCVISRANNRAGTALVMWPPVPGSDPWQPAGSPAAPSGPTPHGCATGGRSSRVPVCPS